jgi:hypothetical protein
LPARPVPTVPLQGGMEVPIRPLVLKMPGERTLIERTFVERHTEPLPVAQPEMAPTAPQIIVVPPIQERTHNEPSIPEQTTPDGNTRRTEGRTDKPQAPAVREAPPVVKSPVMEAPSPEQKQFGPVGEKRSPEQLENVPPENKKRSGNSSPKNSPRNDSELLGELLKPNKPTPQADSEEFEKIGPGRQRRYEDLGEKDVEPIRELVLFRNEFGRHWPGLSKDMEQYYEHFYFTAPNKRKDGKNYAKHVKCWERRTKWLTATESTPDSH